jgi:sugar lactone lactonase YvrE
MMVLVVLCLLPGCGGGSGSSQKLVAITINEGSVSVALGAAGQQFTATGIYNDSTTADLTSSVSWSSSNTSVATISNTFGSNGKTTPLSGGVTTILAASGAVSGSSSLSVVPIGGSSQGTSLSLSGTVTTIAASTVFNLPVGITTDGRFLYVADSNNNIIRKIDISTGLVSILAGIIGQPPATVDTAPGFAARFNLPGAITTDGVSLYVAERQSNSIRKVVISSGAVSTLAHVNSPAGITTDGANLYVTDSVSHVIRRIAISSGVITTLAGSAGVAGSLDETGINARFRQPVGITTDGSNLYVNDFGNNLVRKIIIASGLVSTIVDNSALLVNPSTGITTDGTNLYIADYGNTVRKIVISSGFVSTLVGTGAGLSHPEGLTSDGRTLFISDSLNNLIRRLN